MGEAGLKRVAVQVSEVMSFSGTLSDRFHVVALRKQKKFAESSAPCGLDCSLLHCTPSLPFLSRFFDIGLFL